MADASGGGVLALIVPGTTHLLERKLATQLGREGSPVLGSGTQQSTRPDVDFPGKRKQALDCAKTPFPFERLQFADKATETASIRPDSDCGTAQLHLLSRFASSVPKADFLADLAIKAGLAVLAVVYFL